MQASQLQANMRQDRLNGDTFTESYAESYARLQAMNPSNTTVLPRSPCIRVKKTGVIWPWSEEFAARPDLCECCNEDGSPWEDKTPVAKPEPVQVNGVIERPKINNEHTIAVGQASEKLGVDASFSQDFSVADGTTYEAMPLPKQKSSGPIGAIIDAMFDNQMNK